MCSSAQSVWDSVLVCRTSRTISSAASSSCSNARSKRRPRRDCRVRRRSAEIAARATTIITDENVAIIVPNSQFVSERVVNWSRPGKLTAYAVSFYVSHASDPAAGATGAARRRGRASRVCCAIPHPRSSSSRRALGHSAFQLQVWSSEHLKTAGSLKSDLNFEVWRQLAAAGVTIAPNPGPSALGMPLIGGSRRTSGASLG